MTAPTSSLIGSASSQDDHADDLERYRRGVATAAFVLGAARDRAALQAGTDLAVSARRAGEQRAQAFAEAIAVLSDVFPELLPGDRRNVTALARPQPAPPRPDNAGEPCRRERA